MSNQLHPVFAGILAAHGLPQQEPPLQIRRADYVAALIRCGWTIDSVPGYLDTDAGKDEVDRLWALRKELDPLGYRWFEFAHVAFRDQAR